MLRIDHPDILEFITCKKDNSEINNFNLSIGITNDFMEKLKNNENYDLIHPSTKAVVGKLSSREVFDLIVEMAWNNGEPGIIFIDRVNEYNPTPWLGEIESTNPCAEQPLLPFEACVLASINLSNMVKSIVDNNCNHECKQPVCEGCIDFKKLETTVSLAVRFLDNIIDASVFPIEKIADMVRHTRKIGLGVMGWADMLCKLGIPYNSDEAVKLAGEVMRIIQITSKDESNNIAHEKGECPAFKELAKKQREDGVDIHETNYCLRNATTTTIAPTGTISIICNCSGGIEPLFALAYTRNQADMIMTDVNPLFEEVARAKGFYSEELMRKIADNHGTLEGIKGIPDDVRKVFVTSHEISPEYHVKMQAAFQKYTCNAVSKTINLTNSASKEDVEKAYLLAYETGCKGITVYRDGSRDNQVLSTSNTAKKDDSPILFSQPDTTLRIESSVSPRTRPETTEGYTKKVKTGCGNLYITVNYDEKGICEVFTNTGRAGGCPSQSEATARLVSIALRAGIDVKSIIDQLKGIRCPSTVRRNNDGIKVLSCPDAIGRMLKEVKDLKKTDEVEVESQETSIEMSPWNTLQLPGGFLVCEAIDASKGYNGYGIYMSEDGKFWVPYSEKKTGIRQENIEHEFARTRILNNTSYEYEKVALNNLVNVDSEFKVKYTCPECGAIGEPDSGCFICKNCGFSKCG